MNVVRKLIVLMPVILLVILKQYVNIIFILLLFNILDYITGILASLHNDVKFNYNVAIKGIFKKIMYFAYIMVSVGVDVTVSEYFNVKNQIFLTGIICVWLIGNESISILNNITSVTKLKIPNVLRGTIKKLLGVVDNENNE